MSTINTNGIDVNYPIPGQNNSTQGFRNNFTAIKQNLNTAGTEITDLQNKVVLKSALANSVLNNDMANTLIANASTLQFRATTYNLGNALVDNVTVDCSLGDLQYGNLAGDITLYFGSWAPTNTLSTVKLQLGRPNNQANFTITLPSEAVIDQNSGWALLENSGSNANLATITFPYDTTQLNLTLTSTDCGNTIFVEPTNRPFKTTQIQVRTPPPTGFLGDVEGTVAVDEDYLYVCTGTFDSGGANTITANALSTTASSNVITFDAIPGNVSLNIPVIFDTMFIDGNSVATFGNINAGQVYYVKTVTGANMTISDTRTAGTAGSTLALSDVSANAGNTSMDATFYAGTDIWKRVSLTSW
jgi:hypothetical protein